jgi:hypothetical protein
MLTGARNDDGPLMRLQIVYVNPETGKNTLGPLLEVPLNGENARVVQQDIGSGGHE